MLFSNTIYLMLASAFIAPIVYAPDLIHKIIATICGIALITLYFLSNKF